MAPVFKAVVFDLDGTLVDSVELITVSFQHAIREVLGREASREEAMQHVGTPLKEQMVRISPEHAEELVAVYREFNHREHDRMLKLYDGILDLLDASPRPVAGWAWSPPSPGPPRRWPSTSPASSPTSMRRSAATRPRATSPRRTPILYCLEHLGVAPAEAAYVGDSPADIQAAHAARVVAYRGDLGGVRAPRRWLLKSRRYWSILCPSWRVPSGCRRRFGG